MTHTFEPVFHKIIKKLIGLGKKEALRGLLMDLHHTEIANAISHLKLKQQLIVIENLNNRKAAEVLIVLGQAHLHGDIVARLEIERLRDLIDHLPADDAADLVSVLPDPQAAAVLESLSTHHRQEISRLLQYGEETAGGIMDPHVAAIKKDETVAGAVQRFRRHASDHANARQFYTLYVVDEYQHLIGSVKTTDLLLADAQTKISEIMDPDVVAVNVELDREEVARIARAYNLVVVPVIDRHLRLVGRITFEDLVHVISEEYAEDMAHMAGTGNEEVLESSVWRTIRDRLPWLFLGLGGGFLAALVMSYYETALTELPQVAYFVPLIAALGGNIGIQSSSIVVRGLATGVIHTSDLFVRLWKELRVGFTTGMICALVMVLMAWLLTKDLSIGLSTGVAVLLVVTSAAIIGAGVPILLKRIHIDPALATGPFITTANDVFGISIYLIIAFTAHQYSFFP